MGKNAQPQLVCQTLLSIEYTIIVAVLGAQKGYPLGNHFRYRSWHTTTKQIGKNGIYRRFQKNDIIASRLVHEQTILTVEKSFMNTTYRQKFIVEEKKL